MRSRWLAAGLALLLGSGTLAILHTSGKLFRLEWLAHLLWLAPVLAMVERYRAERRNAADLRPDRPGLAPLLVLSAAMTLALFSSSVCHPWFFFLDWAPDTRDPWMVISSGISQFVLLTALLTPFLVRGVRRPGMWTGLIFVAGIVVSVGMLFHVTGGKALWRDDHPSFLFRLYAFGQTFPRLVNYMPHWNAGVVDSVGVTSGILGPGLLFLPFWKWGAAEAVYTPATAAMFILLAPLLAACSARIAGGGRTASWTAGILALGVSRHFSLEAALRNRWRGFLVRLHIAVFRRRIPRHPPRTPGALAGRGPYPVGLRASLVAARGPDGLRRGPCRAAPRPALDMAQDRFPCGLRGRRGSVLSEVMAGSAS